MVGVINRSRGFEDILSSVSVRFFDLARSHVFGISNSRGGGGQSVRPFGYLERHLLEGTHGCLRVPAVSLVHTIVCCFHEEKPDQIEGKWAF